MYHHGIIEFIKDYPGMTIAPSQGKDITLKGIFKFKATVEGFPEVEDSYNISIVVPNKFPFHLPTVREMGGKIPRDLNYHVNPDDTLCLGSPLRLLKKLNNNPSIVIFAEECLVPFLYAVSYKIKNGGNFIFGELAHGQKGIIEDYTELFGLKSREQVIYALKLLSIKKRLANKQACPCKCGKRLGTCNFHKVLNRYRKIAPASYYIEQLQNVR